MVGETPNGIDEAGSRAAEGSDEVSRVLGTWLNGVTR